MSKTDIDILVCTFRRPGVEDTLSSIDAQILPPGVAIRIIVADNDDNPTAELDVSRAAAQMKTPVVYLHAPSRNISIARNACLERADADWIAFIDDDERAASDWLASLLAAAKRDCADGAFGPVKAQYGHDAPDWVREYDYLSTWPEARGGEVQTGYTGNAILRWRGSFFVEQRFSLKKGKTGGEDTEFFFRLWRAGARFSIADSAFVYEGVESARLSFHWIRKRRFRAGQSYGRHCAAPSLLTNLRLAIASCGKIAVCVTMTGVRALSISKRRYWLLRSAFHCGVLSSTFGGRESVSYGN
ncbi:MAG: glycosyltransferase family 2 protein [Pseudomonadota bacterium]